MEPSLCSGWQVNPLQVSATPPQVSLHNKCEALDVAGLSADNMDDGPSTPEVLPNQKGQAPCHDHHHEEEKMSYRVVPSPFKMLFLKRHSLLPDSTLHTSYKYANYSFTTS